MKNSIEGRLIVSCHADTQDASYGLMEGFAPAGGVRPDNPGGVRAMSAFLDLPIIRIQKRMYLDRKILIASSLGDSGTSPVRAWL